MLNTRVKNERKPEFITFTGIDDSTDLNRATELASRYPIEWGVLIAPGFKNVRYPRLETIDTILSIDGNKSAHLCGRVARDAQKGIYDSELPLHKFNRIQINGGGICKDKFTELENKFSVNVITQVRQEGFSISSHQELYDCSGGKGTLPDSIPSHPDGKQIVGFAGGMGPETINPYLSMLTAINGPFWIDMEENVRTNNLFDLDKVEQVCELVYG